MFKNSSDSDVMSIMIHLLFGNYGTIIANSKRQGEIFIIFTQAFPIF